MDRNGVSNRCAETEKYLDLLLLDLSEARNVCSNSLDFHVGLPRSWRSFMVVVHEGRDLAAMDFFTSDPYCVVQCVAAMHLASTVPGVVLLGIWGWPRIPKGS